MNVLETEWWSLCLPPEWWGEQEEDSILVGDRDGVGCIEISTLLREEGKFSDRELQELAISAQDQEQSLKAVRVADGSGWYLQYLEPDAAVREWYLGYGTVALFVSYSCEPENAGLDDAIVDEILGTLSVDDVTQQSSGGGGGENG